MCVARHINRIETLRELPYPVPWQPEAFLEVCHRLEQRGETVFGGAYVIPAGRSGYKADYLAVQVFTPLWEARDAIAQTYLAPGATLTSIAAHLSKFRGLGGGFMCAQIIADIKYAPHLRSASDWWTFARSGPGSRQGLNRWLGRPAKTKWDESDWKAQLLALAITLTPRLADIGLPRLHLQDWQNVMCEANKYLRTRFGEGRPKRKYNGKS